MVKVKKKMRENGKKLWGNYEEYIITSPKSVIFIIGCHPALDFVA